MKVIFMDVDGVLNSIQSMLVRGTYDIFDPTNVGLVARLAKEGDAKIVVSSSWRTGDLMNTRKALRKSGGKRLDRYIIDETPRISTGHRGTEIRAWLEDQGKKLDVQEYVILDDDSDMLPGQSFVQTSIATGFGLKEYVDALEYLNPDHFDLSKRGIVKMVRTSSRLSYAD